MPTPLTQPSSLLHALSALPTQLAAELGGLDAVAAARRPTPGEWSATETVTHLAAGEAPFLTRVRRIVAEDNPFLPYFGPDVARPDASQRLPEALAHFAAERARLVDFLAGLPDDAWERPAVHETLGATTLARQAQNIIDHDQEHLAQLRAGNARRAGDGRG
jgi:hypothetical protein